MSDKDIALHLLYQRLNKVLFFKAIHPKDIYNIVVDFLSTNGCRNRSDYEQLIIYLFRNDCYNRNILLED